jgi:uncharacterized membrane protein YbhN (UPF0104 family)
MIEKVNETPVKKRTKPWVFPLQILVSLAVIALLVRQAEIEDVRAELAGASLGWLLVATIIKAASLTLHEIRLWVSLMPDHKRPAWPVISIGYTSGLANSILPARGGDLVAIALLKKEQDVPVPAAVAAVGVTALLEALVFALFLVAVMFMGATQWEQLIGPEKAQQILWVLLACCVFAVGFAVLAIFLARKRKKRSREQAPPKGGLKGLVRKTLEESGATLGAGRFVALNLALAAIQVGLVVGCFLALLPTVGIELEPHMPVLAVSGVIAFGALSAIVLPPSLGAGPAVSAGFVYGFFEVSHDQALAFAAMSWIANTTPVLVLGLWPLLRRIRRFGGLESLTHGVETKS